LNNGKTFDPITVRPRQKQEKNCLKPESRSRLFIFCHLVNPGFVRPSALVHSTILQKYY